MWNSLLGSLGRRHLNVYVLASQPLRFNCGNQGHAVFSFFSYKLSIFLLNGLMYRLSECLLLLPFKLLNLGAHTPDNLRLDLVI